MGIALNTDFKWRHYRGEIILWTVRWYCRYGISYRELDEMLCERGVDVDHTTIYRWVHRYAPEIEKRLRWQYRPRSFAESWRVDETYIKAKGKWAYLYRAVTKSGDTIDFYLSSTRNAKALRPLKDWQKPYAINTDKAGSYSQAIGELKKQGKCPGDLDHRQAKYLNNVVESDHGKLKRLIKPTLGFKSMKTAYATIKGFEAMRAPKKRQASGFNFRGDIKGKVRIIERAFGLGNGVMADMMHGLENCLKAA